MKDPMTVLKSSVALTLEPGEYYWCACGKSKNQPFCDGSHLGTGFSPVNFRIETKKDVFLCQCKHSSNKPFCDGTHRQI